MLIQSCLPPPLTSTVKSSLFTYAHSSPLSLVATSQGCHTKHSRYINNGWAFSSQTFCSLVQTHANTKANSHVGMWMNGFINSWLDSFCFANKNNTVPITLIFSFFFHYTGGKPPKTEFIYLKNCAFILTRLKFSHLQSTLHVMHTPTDMFFPLLRAVFGLVDFDAF